MSWKPEVIADNSGQWLGNGLRFATKKEAEDNARDLMWRWMAVKDTRAKRSKEPVNYAWIRGKLETVNPQETVS
jgi:hypothetical protein